MTQYYDVYGMGNALVDKEFTVTDDFIAQQGIEKGLMTLVDESRHHELLAELQTRFQLTKRTAGGSGGNTIVAISQFGAKTFYACKVASDEYGKFYMDDLHAAGVRTQLAQLRANSGDGVTGKCMVMVTPDAERTMNTFLGITTDFSSHELPLDELKKAKYLYIEGYLVTSDKAREAIRQAREIAREQQIKVALTFSDPSMASYFKDGLTEVIAEGVDVLFCNRQEATAYTGEADLEAAIAQLKTLAKKLVLTLGSDGAVIINPDNRVTIAPVPTKAIDTNGAGDLFAGAFMYGLTQGMSDQQAGDLASRSASQIVSQFGARLDKEDYQALLKTS